MAELKVHELHDTEFPIPDEIRGNVAITSLSRFSNWSRRSSIWPLLFGLACCAIEMICTAAARYDLARFGMEVMSGSPRQSDLMLVSGTVTKKMIEDPRGELGFYVVSAGDPKGNQSPWHYHVRGARFVNLTSLGEMCQGHKVADAVAILGSIDIVLGEVDR